MSPAFSDVSRNNEHSLPNFQNPDRQVAGQNVEGFYTGVPDRLNYNYIQPNPRQVQIGSSANSTADGMDLAQQQPFETNGPAYFNKPRFALNTDLNDIDQ